MHRTAFTPLGSRGASGLSAAMLESSSSLDPGLPSPAWEELVLLCVFYSNSQVQVRDLDPALGRLEGIVVGHAVFDAK